MFTFLTFEKTTCGKKICVFMCYSYIDTNTGQATVRIYDNMESCVIDDVSLSKFTLWITETLDFFFIVPSRKPIDWTLIL